LLIPRGWQRSGGLAVLFDPAVGPLRAGLTVPDHLISPAAGNPAKTIAHRTYKTILAVSERTAIPIDSPYPEGAEPALVQALLDGYPGTILICWEHHHIPALATAIPTTPTTTIPATWPGHRFDVIWSFRQSPETVETFVYGDLVVCSVLCAAREWGRRWVCPRCAPVGGRRGLPGSRAAVGRRGSDRVSDP
jgi:hypothetical protein